MKKKYFFMTATLEVALVWAIVSCNKIDNKDNDPVDNSPKAVQFTSAIGNMAQQTRTNGDAWVQDDAIGVFMVDKGGTNVLEGAINKLYKASASNNTLTPAESNTIYYPTDDTDVDFIAYYPYKGSINSLGTYSVDVATQANPANIDLLYAKTTGGYKKSSQSNVSLAFKHQLTKLILNVIAPTDPSSSLSEMTVVINGLNTKANFNLATGALETSNTPATITPLTIMAGKYEAIILPETIAANQVTVEFTINPSTTPEIFVWKVDAGTFAPETVYTYNVSLVRTGVSVSGTINQWTGGENGSDVTAK
jgi:hypothetical protein